MASAPVANPAQHPKVVEVQGRLTEMDREILALEAGIVSATADRDAAAAAAADAQVARIMGTGSAPAESQAGEHAAKAAAALADLERRLPSLREARRLSEPFLVDVLDVVKIAAREELRRQYVAAIQRMDAALEAASEANEAAWQIYENAQELFGTEPTVSSRGARHPSYGGLPHMAWQQLGLPDQSIHGVSGGPTRFEDWRNDGRTHGLLK